MISNQVISKTIEDLHTITRIGFTVYDVQGRVISDTADENTLDPSAIAQFASSPADSQEISGYYFFKVEDEGATEYILVSCGKGEDAYTMGKVAVASLQRLMEA